MYMEAREQVFDALRAMQATLGADEDFVKPEHLDRLVRDRDEMLTQAHFTFGIPVLDLAQCVGIRWPQVYEIVDRIREEYRANKPRKSAIWSWPVDDTPPEPKAKGDASKPDLGDSE